jgi:hypothetical protein
MADFAKYTLNSDSSATLKLDSLGINLNLNYIDLQGGEHSRYKKKDSSHEEATQTNDIADCTEYYCIKPEWNYDLHGDDWAEKYPNCG